MDIATQHLVFAEGNHFLQKIHFAEDWCKAFLELSGDRNISLHSVDGMRIVQGAALITKIATFVSEEMPGWAAYEFADKIKFRKPIFIGDYVIMKLNITQVGRVRVVAELTVCEDNDAGIVLMQIPIVLAHQKLLTRMQ